MKDHKQGKSREMSLPLVRGKVWMEGGWTCRDSQLGQNCLVSRRYSSGLSPSRTHQLMGEARLSGGKNTSIRII